MAEAQTEFYIDVSSLYRHASIRRLDDGTVLHTLPERLPYENRDDTTIHIATGGAYLWDLAKLHYGQTQPSAWDLWEVIAEFQPVPITDASLPLRKGTEIHIPSDEYIAEVVDGAPLSDTPEI